MSIKSDHTCRHCQAPVFNNHYCIEDNLFCCSGCAQVFQFLRSQKLDGFYEILEKVGEKTDSLNDYEAPQYFSQSEKGSLEELRLNFNPSGDTWEFYLPKIHCAACLWLIEKILQPFSWIRHQDVNIFQQKLTITTKPQIDFQSLKKLLNALHNCGYTPLPMGAKAEAHRSAHRESLISLSLSGFCFGNIMLISFALYFGEGWDMTPQFEQFFRWLSALFTLPVLWAGRSFFTSAYEGIKRKAVTIDLPIAFASGMSLLLSYWHTAKGEGAIYYDSVSALFFFLLLGRFILKVSLDRNRHIEKQVKSLVPRGAKNLAVGSTVTVAMGQVFPVDGTITSGKTLVNEAVLTGEERSISKKPGDRVLAGTVNMENPVSVRVEKSGEGTWIASLQSLIEKAQSSHTSLGDIMSRVVPWFTFTITTVCLLGVLYWWYHDPLRIPEVTLAILVASCPCALGLAAPLTFSQAIKRCWDSRVAVKSALQLENLATVDTVIFDKTGTLTKLQPKALKLELFNTTGKQIGLGGEVALLQEVYSALRHSAHPVSLAALRALENDAPEPLQSTSLEEMKEVKGAGIQWKQGRLGKASYVFRGHVPAWLTEGRGESHHKTYAKIGDKILVIFIEQTLMEGSYTLIQKLKKLGKEILIYSGDKKEAVEKASRQLKIPLENSLHGMSPEEKYEGIAKIIQSGKKVAFVGDGVNDAAALKKAHIAVSASGSVDLAFQSAHIALMDKDISVLGTLFSYSHYATNTLKILIFLSLIYNIVAISLAFTGILTPLLAAILMPLSSLTIVIVNQLRKGDSIWKSSSSSSRS